MIEFYGGFVYNFQINFNNNGWIRIRMDRKLLPGSGTRKIQSWIRVRNKSFRIHNNAGNNNLFNPFHIIPLQCLQQTVLILKTITGDTIK